jgi:hypothetical protein
LGAVAQQAADMDTVKAANQAFYAALSALDIGAMQKVWCADADIQNIGPSDGQLKERCELLPAVGRDALDPACWAAEASKYRSRRHRRIPLRVGPGLL